ncbi:MAG: HutD family protein [Comamonas sp.]
MSSPITPRSLADVAAEPWKNGGGLTQTLAAFGDEWRVSLARIERDGAYSVFDGMNRLSAILHGAGLDLRHAHGARRLAPWTPVAYDGSHPWQAVLRDGPCSALNVMARRGRWCAHLQPARGRALLPPAAVAVLLAGAQPLAIRDIAGTHPAVTLQPGQFACIAPVPAARYETLAASPGTPGAWAEAPAFVALVTPAPRD